MNPNLISKIVYDFALNHLKMTVYEDELFNEDINQYIYSDRAMDQEPVMQLKLSAGELLYILAKSDEKFI